MFRRAEDLAGPSDRQENADVVPVHALFYTFCTTDGDLILLIILYCNAIIAATKAADSHSERLVAMCFVPGKE
jgi:hypothetical protein